MKIYTPLSVHYVIGIFNRSGHNNIHPLIRNLRTLKMSSRW